MSDKCGTGGLGMYHAGPGPGGHTESSDFIPEQTEAVEGRCEEDLPDQEL